MTEPEAHRAWPRRDAGRCPRARRQRRSRSSGSCRPGGRSLDLRLPGLRAVLRTGSPTTSSGCGRAAIWPSAVQFFVFEAPKVLMLLTVVVFGVGIVRSFFTPERTRRILAGKREVAGNVLAGLLGRRDAVLLLLGRAALHRLRDDRGPARRHASPSSSPRPWSTRSPSCSSSVSSAGRWPCSTWAPVSSIAIVGGWVLGRLRLERWVEGWVYEMSPGRAGQRRRARADLGRSGRPGARRR